jgi:3,4-dihydroxy 2-butanone 4-phosphate synthase/GTP cyclohydrolase II
MTGDRDNGAPSGAKGGRVIAHRSYHQLWEQPAALITGHKELLRKMGEPLAEKLADSPLWVRISTPVPLPYSEITALDSTEHSEVNLRMVTERDSEFRMYVFGDRTTGEEHVALIKGIGDGTNVPIRVHSSCITAETFHATNCDCHQQLEQALDIADKAGMGGVIWLHQEGRGNGLVGKAHQLEIMYGQGVDTVEAFERAGYPTDQRDYSIAADVLKILGISSIRLITNNPEKVRQLSDAGILIVDRIPSITPPMSEVARKDLNAKRDRLGHHLPE